jgi:hypothetical protein
MLEGSSEQQAVQHCLKRVTIIVPSTSLFSGTDRDDAPSYQLMPICLQVHIQMRLTTRIKQLSAMRTSLTCIASLTLTLLLNPAYAANATSVGLAWANQLWVPMSGFTSPGTLITTYYTWSPQPVIPTPQYPPSFAVPFEFIPMLWGCTDDHVKSFSTAISRYFDNVNLTRQKDILGFNEPDLAVQSNCSPEKAAEVWKSTLEPLRARGYRLGGPAMTSGPGGKEWLREWFEACQEGCNPDFVPVHWVSGRG